ncbi:UDP-N-acetylglucosamine-N-acetylmuramyl-pyrophosphoryl-undecaprenol N-acetylglucosamine protein [Trema orientale]|uniref:UDP-N-acetylglucosamine-N-acetylmuramyl-pyrophosphoryl-undecaprenol N-acetylglucosamine protein n=1 Tax=Trema orientale TaxID=63057 RepID=A0A2P5CF32_TREOI|nr:UDP-N-acetylglucosamine-N-acetylmuramyl-pyrophosphoryl-undecaprenol N-acetylglucosamine protein [Trema orientale]
MSFLTGSSGSSWQPIMTGDTTVSSYWLNWRVLICALWVLTSMTLALLIILKFEGFGISRQDIGETQQKRHSGILYEDDTWKPCLKNIHPAWLLAFRLVAFFVLLVLLIVTASVDGGAIFYYYTQWTFTLVTIYFGLGSLLSMYGCYRYHQKASGDKVGSVEIDAEQGTYMTPALVIANTSNRGKNLGPHAGLHARKPAGFWSYVFQIIFQMNAGAVILTDCVFWFIIVPFLTIKDYNLNFLIINMHTINAVFLLGETALNCLRFPWFRIGYFFLWTVFYVIFQWILHACVKLWWPYPFLDLSSPYAPLWYLSVALMHIPCYGIFALIMKLKHHVYSTKYPDSYQCEK